MPDATTWLINFIRSGTPQHRLGSLLRTARQTGQTVDMGAVMDAAVERWGVAGWERVVNASWEPSKAPA